MDVDVIIPLYKPDQHFFLLLDRLEGQSVPIRNILLVNTGEEYFGQLVQGTDFYDKYKNVKVYHLAKHEFDHGGTRRKAVAKSDAGVFVMMTQDALPADRELVGRLLEPLREGVAVSYARQLPKEGCSIEERLSRAYNYPGESCVRAREDLPRLGIKTYFCSNVCAAYRRDIYEELGGFVRHTIFNEDMLYAAAAVKAGYQIAYAASARVYHSHDYTNVQQFRRNFDLGVSQAEHPEVFAGISSESEGRKMVGRVAAYLRRHGMLGRLPHFYMQCACKYLGYLLGRGYRYLPRKLVLQFTSNREYWLGKE